MESMKQSGQVSAQGSSSFVAFQPSLGAGGRQWRWLKERTRQRKMSDPPDSSSSRSSGRPPPR